MTGHPEADSPMASDVTIQPEGEPTLEIEDHLGILRLNRPYHHNRLEPADLDVLSALLDIVAGDSRLRVLILTAAGSSFSAGYHLGALRDPVEPDSSDPTPFARLVDRLEVLPQPSVAALNGSVYGGATDLALACDFRIGVRTMKLRMPAARLGIHYYAGGLRRFVERLGPNAAKRLFLVGDELAADELLRIGYLDRVVEAEQLMPVARTLARQLADNAPGAVQTMKQALNGISRGEFDARALDRAHRISLSSAEAREGIAAWHERRPPRFTGA